MVRRPKMPISSWTAAKNDAIATSCERLLLLGLGARVPKNHVAGAASHCVEIVESRAGKQHPRTAEGDCLRFQQAPLAGSLRKRAVCANDTMPWRFARIGAAQHMARQTRRAG
jgi:hypothetical protein